MTTQRFLIIDEFALIPPQVTEFLRMWPKALERDYTGPSDEQIRREKVRQKQLWLQSINKRSARK